MGYIILRRGRLPGDPKWNFWGTIIIYGWIFVLIFIPDKSDNTYIRIFRMIWVTIPCVVIGGLILFVIFGIIIYQLSLRFPDKYDKLNDKLTEWIEDLTEKYL